MKNCPFCLGSDPGDCSVEAVAAEHSAIRKRVLEIQFHTYIAAALGPVVSPYILFVTRRHISGIGEAVSEERHELFQFLELCLSKKIFPSGRLTVFEHAGRGRAKCNCVDHCHLHIVDGAFNLADVIAQTSTLAIDMRLELGTQGALTCTSEHVWAGRYESGSAGIVGKAVILAGREQQYFRRILAFYARTDEWDWRIFPRWEYIDKLVARWRQPPAQLNPPL